MRTWLVAAGLAMVVVLSLVARSVRGWDLSKREADEQACDRRDAKACERLGLDLSHGSTGPRDLERGLVFLGRACTLELDSGCLMLGFAQHQTDELGAHEAYLSACRLGSWDGCAWAGVLERFGPKSIRDEDTARTHLMNACANGSTEGCTALGERALEHHASAEDLVRSTSAFHDACVAGHARACLRFGQALACGRGLERDAGAALERFRTACASGSREGCFEQLQLDSPDASLDPKNDALLSELRWRFISTDGPDGGASGLTLPDDDQSRFVSAVMNLRYDRLDDAEATLARVPTDGGRPELAVARAVLSARRAGRPWPDAAWVGWARAGFPDLRNSGWLPRATDFDPGRCGHRPAVTETTDDAFLRAFARTEPTSKAEAIFDPSVVRAALRLSTRGSDPVRLVALSVLARTSRDEGPGAVRDLDGAARADFARSHPDSLSDALLALPDDLTEGAASEDDLAELERVDHLPWAPPRAAIFEAFTHALGPGADATAFGALVSTLVDVHHLSSLAAWLERGHLPAQRRAAVLWAIGDSLSQSDWLVDRFIGLPLLRASVALDDEPAHRELVTSRAEALRVLYGGPHSVQALGRWPWPEPIDDGHREIAEYQRLRALAESAR